MSWRLALRVVAGMLCRACKQCRSGLPPLHLTGQYHVCRPQGPSLCSINESAAHALGTQPRDCKKAPLVDSCLVDVGCGRKKSINNLKATAEARQTYKPKPLNRSSTLKGPPSRRPRKYLEMQGQQGLALHPPGFTAPDHPLMIC